MVSKSVDPLSRDRWFESAFLQQTVRLSRDFSFLYRKAGSCRGVRGSEMLERGLAGPVRPKQEEYAGLVRQ
jgi:hypothetical protein